MTPLLVLTTEKEKANAKLQASSKNTQKLGNMKIEVNMQPSHSRTSTQALKIR